MKIKKVVDLSARFLQCKDESSRDDLKKELLRCRGPIDPVLKALKPTPPSRVEKRGLTGLVHFELEEFKEKYQEDHLYYHVPRSYHPQKPTGLLIYLHGGGGGTPREYAGQIINKRHKYAYCISRFIDRMAYITVAPSAPWDDNESDRWGMAQADEYIAAVIRESESRFAIDPDRVVLAGWSMGGMGAYRLGLRLADRFALVSPGAGAWAQAFYRVCAGTRIFIIHGSHDPIPPGNPKIENRPIFTDPFYARHASRLLSKHGIEHVYAEHDKGHPTAEAHAETEMLVSYMVYQRRDPFFPRVVAATPADGRCSTLHNRWVSIAETGKGQLVFDGIVRHGGSWKETLEEFKASYVEPVRIPVKGAGFVDAVNCGGNQFKIAAHNVRQFTLWLHPQMINFSKPVKINLNGKSIQRRAEPRLVTALESYLRRQDWGLIYHGRIELEA